MGWPTYWSPPRPQPRLLRPPTTFDKVLGVRAFSGGTCGRALRPSLLKQGTLHEYLGGGPLQYRAILRLRDFEV